MMKHVLKTMCLATLLPLTAIAADEMTPWYVGGGVGVNNYEPNCDQKTMKKCGEDEPYAWDIFAGYLFNDYFGVELGYRQLGRAEWVDYSNKLNDVGAKGMSLGGVGFWPFAEDWSLSTEVGLLNYRISNNKQYGSEYYSDSGIAPYIGAGLGYNISENLMLQVKYRRYESLDEDKWKTLAMESNYWGLALSYRFGKQTKPVATAMDDDGDQVPNNLDQCINTPSNHKVDHHGCTVYKDIEESFNIEAKFANDSAVVKPSAYRDIRKLAVHMKQNPNTKVTISGHASNIGNSQYNMELSEKRAEAVARVLTAEYGIAKNRVSYKGYGDTRPLFKGSSMEANTANRRIEARVFGTKKVPVLK